jgi:hypothetical protein
LRERWSSDFCHLLAIDFLTVTAEPALRENHASENLGTPRSDAPMLFENTR